MSASAACGEQERKHVMPTESTTSRITTANLIYFKLTIFSTKYLTEFRIWKECYEDIFSPSNFYFQQMSKTLQK